jgi:ABC-type lipoprotein release transport system permease subunit
MYARLVMWSLRQRRGRHLLNALIMAIMVAVIALFVSVVGKLVTFAQGSANKELARILVWPSLLQAGGNDLPMAFYPIIKQIEGVKVVQCHKFMLARHEGITYMISGEEESGIELNQDLLPVDNETFEAWKATKPMGAIVTETTARELNLKVGQEAEIPTTYGPLKLKIVGLSSGGMIARRISPHFDYLQQFAGNQGTCLFRVFTAHGDFERVAKEIVERTRNSPNPAQALSDSEIAAGWMRDVAFVPTLLGFLGLFLALTTALTLANTSAISIRERRTEIATLRVLGFRKHTIATVMLLESMLVGLAGGVVAIVVLTLAIGKGIQLTPGGARVLSDVTLTPVAIVIGLLVSIVVPLAGALPAAITAVRMRLVDSLRDTA